MTRRTLLASMPAAALAAAQTQNAVTGIPSRMKRRASKDVEASPIGIGFETLDRKMFDPERCYPHMAKLGVKWARCQTGWARTETRKGEYDFRWLDEIVDNLLATGIQPWFNVGYGNTLYTPGPKHESAVGWAPLNSTEAQGAWVRFVEKLAEHFSKRVRHWELWNEPNIAAFWQPDTPNPARYVELCKLTAPAIRKRVPGAVLIGGAYAGMGALDYFDGAMDAGLGDVVDRISFHPYRPIPELNYAADLAALRGIVHRRKPGMPLWQGENGAPSTDNSTGALNQLEWDEARQAKWLLRRLLTDVHHGIEMTSYFQTADMAGYIWTTGQSGMTNSKGVLRAHEYTPKASFYALQNLCSVIDAQSKQAPLLLRVDGGGPAFDINAMQYATFVRGDTPLYFWWYPSDLQRGFESQKARVTVWGGNATKLNKPVIADLLTGDVKPAPEAKASGRTMSFADAPVRDYPLLLTDASLFL